MDVEEARSYLDDILTVTGSIRDKIGAIGEKEPELGKEDWKRLCDMFEDVSDTASEIMFKISDYLEE